MAITFEATYAKKLGLPNYSSHQYSVTIRTELTDLSTVEEASTRLYGILQDAVDREIQHVGFMPDATTYGMKNGNGHGSNGGGHGMNGNGHASNGDSTNGHQRPAERWNCTDGQRTLILRMVEENNLDKNLVEQISQELFSVGVKACDKMQASQLIEELFERTGKSRGRQRWSRRQPARAS